MLIEFAGKRLLLGADAHADVLLAAIKRLSPHSRLKVDVWKMPHHGSAANITDDLLDAVDAKTFIFSSNGAYFRHPDKVAVARVLRRYKGQSVELVFNYRTEYNAPWDNGALRTAWGYSTTYGLADQGVSFQLL
jgi:beta-lactamase superfamily II metal-dependent hydrolase